MEKIDFVNRLHQDVLDSKINENDFFKKFSSEVPTKEVAEFFSQQYYYYIRTFPQILAGLSHRVSSEKVRLEISKTVVSELGAGHGPAHFNMFEDVLKSVGILLAEIDQANYIQEAIDLVDGLREIFLLEHPDVALGGHYAIEETGLPMIKNLYEGFRQMKGGTTESLGYFYLHLFLEVDHVDWITKAVIDRAGSIDAQERMAEGNRRVLVLLNSFWAGLYRDAYKHGLKKTVVKTVSLIDAAKTRSISQLDIR